MDYNTAAALPAEIVSALGIYSCEARTEPLVKAYRAEAADMLRLLVCTGISEDSAEAMTDLGNMYYHYHNSIQISENETKALECYNAALNMGDETACLELADYHYFHREYMKAIDYYKRCLEMTGKFSESGLGTIHANLGDSYSKLASPDMHSACNHLQIGAEKYKNGFAARRLWQIFREQDKDHRDTKRIISFLELSTKCGDAVSAVVLAAAYMFGNENIGITKDLPAAEQVLLPLEGINDSEILYYLGRLYLMTWDKQDRKKAAEYLDRAYTLNKKIAGWLGFACFMTDDHAKALDKLIEAFNGGDYNFAYLLGDICYGNGYDLYGVNRTKEEAKKYLDKAYEIKKMSTTGCAVHYAELLEYFGEYDKEWEVCEYGLKTFEDNYFFFIQTKLILSGKSDKESIDTALSWADQLAPRSAHYGKELYFLQGAYYLSKPDYLKAKEKYELAFQAGNTEAGIYIGRLWERGFIDPDKSTSVAKGYEWYCKAAEAGNEKAKAETACFERVGLFKKLKRVRMAEQ